jgi:hypothetical protein
MLAKYFLRRPFTCDPLKKTVCPKTSDYSAFVRLFKNYKTGEVMQVCKSLKRFSRATIYFI